MSKEILIKHGNRKLIIEAFQTTYPTVIAALRFQTDSILAKRIRHFATNELGGVIIEH